MFGLTDKILAMALGATALVLGVLLLIQTGALRKAERRADKLEVTLFSERAAWDKERVKAANALIDLTTEYRDAEQNLVAQAAQLETEKNEQVAVLSSRADDLRKRLRHQADNDATARLVSKTPATSGADHVAESGFGNIIPYRVGDDLIRLAERAETIRLQLATCQAQYEQARGALGQ